MKRGKLICFIGVDGSGKTTLSKYLVGELHDNGKKAKYTYGRFQPFLLRPFMFIGNKIFLRNKDMFSDYSDYSRTKINAAKKHTILSKIYQRALIGEYRLQLLFKISLPLRFCKKTIVSDRYIFDTVITDLAVDFNYSYKEIKNLLERMIRPSLKPDIVFFINIPEKIAYQRKDDTPSVNYLKDRKNSYVSLAREYNFKLIDGTTSLEKLKKIIKCNIMELFDE